MSELCRDLHLLLNGCEMFQFPFDLQNIPQNGIYILFESGEIAHQVKRVVRVGTHTGNNQLPSRLRQHFVQENKDRSIFRKNIGRALLNKDNDPFLKQWEIDLTTRQAKEKYSKLIDFQHMVITEKRVTEYIQSHFEFVVIRVNEKEERLNLESKLISSISICRECKPSIEWLGRYSPKDKIRESGLWLVNELYKKELDSIEFQKLKKIITGSI